VARAVLGGVCSLAIGEVLVQVVKQLEPGLPDHEARGVDRGDLPVGCNSKGSAVHQLLVPSVDLWVYVGTTLFVREAEDDFSSTEPSGYWDDERRLVPPLPEN
jgi:hypothetical protein